ncbi:MAG: hypothetical protein AB2A00_00465 [Myxococcota bacterium]
MNFLRAHLMRCGLTAALLLACTPEPANPPAPAAVCTDTCESLGHDCGTVCGVACGGCEEGQACLGGHCRCAPSCGEDSCGADDGCGGTCPCAGATSCLECPLRLVLVDQWDDGVAVARVTVALESMASGSGDVLARVADLRFSGGPGLRLTAAQLGPALREARKELHRFARTNLPFEQLEDGTWRILVRPRTINPDVPPGRWLTMTWERTGPADGAPVTVSLVRRPQLLAPAAADSALQATPYDRPLTISVRR